MRVKGAELSAPPLAVYLLAACLREAGHEVDVLDPVEMDRGMTSPEIGTRSRSIVSSPEDDIPELRLRATRADLVGISSNTFGWPAALRMIRVIRRACPGLPIVLGGTHPTYLAEDVLCRTSADYVVRGEGERALVRLADALDGPTGSLADVPGLSYRKGESVVHNPSPEPLPVECLNELPLPAYDLLPAGAYRAISLETSRGCRYACSFCSIPHQALWRGLGVDAVRRRIDHAIRFAGKLQSVSRYGSKTSTVLTFVDDCFSIDMTRAVEILRHVLDCDLRAQGMELSYEARATDMCHPQIGECLARIPLQMILLGADCGYDEGLKRIGKGMKSEDIRAAAAAAQRAGFMDSLLFAFIIGYPWERKTDVLRTLDFAYELSTQYGAATNINWLLCLPGSRFWERRHEMGFHLDPHDYDEIGVGTFELLRRTAFQLSTEDFAEIAAYHRYCAALASLGDRHGRMIFRQVHERGPEEFLF